MPELERFNASIPKAKQRNQNAHLRSIAIEIGDIAPGVEYWIVQSPLTAELLRMRDGEAQGLLPPGFVASISEFLPLENSLNGYVAFPKRRAPLRARSQSDSILAFIPVHGGVTYAAKDQTACVYGFDTAHFDSAKIPSGDPKFIRWQCQILYEALRALAPVERRYLRGTKLDRAEIGQAILDLVPESPWGIGLIINALTGDI